MGEQDKTQSFFEKKADTYYRKGNYWQALDCYLQALKIHPTKTSLHVGKGNRYRKLGDVTQAHISFDHALQYNPQSVEAYNGRCYLYIQTEQLDLALATHEKAITTDPNNASAYNVRGQILRLQQNFREALQAFDKAISLAGPTDDISDYYYNKGLTLFDIERYFEALDAYKEARRRKPKNSIYRQALISAQRILEMSEELDFVHFSVSNRRLAGAGSTPDVALNRDRGEKAMSEKSTRPTDADAPWRAHR